MDIRKIIPDLDYVKYGDMKLYYDPKDDVFRDVKIDEDIKENHYSLRANSVEVSPGVVNYWINPDDYENTKAEVVLKTGYDEDRYSPLKEVLNSINKKHRSWVNLKIQDIQKDFRHEIDLLDDLLSRPNYIRNMSIVPYDHYSSNFFYENLLNRVRNLLRYSKYLKT